MTISYKLLKDRFGNLDSIRKIDEQGIHHFIPRNEENHDYQEYLKWLAEGNTPEPADEPA